ncbi:MAG: hypothetical protein R3C42_09070 [Parvularculaceae bacterium]
MKIAIIETGAPPEQLNGKHRLIRKHERMLTPCRRVFVLLTLRLATALPKPADFDGLLITGSPAGVYEDHD